MTLPQYMKMSKPALIRKITKALKAMPKAKLARLCYNITKSKLPRLRKSLKKHRPKSTRLVKIPISTPLGETYTYAPAGTSELAAQRFYDEGIEGRKALPKRKTKRKFSRKQLAAQRLFAKRSRAGTLKTRYTKGSGKRRLR